MRDFELFKAALALGDKWIMSDTQFSAKENRLDIYLNFLPGIQFSCPICGKKCGAYDTSERIWQHLNFFQYKRYIHAWLSRVDC